MLKRLVVLAALVAVIAMSMACGSGGNPSADSIAQEVGSTINQPGMVYHAVANDGTEVWIDAPDQLYRKTSATAEGKFVSVGQGWTQTSYDPFANSVGSKDNTPQGSATPRINNPAVDWTDALSALGFGNQLQVIGKETADGVQVWVLEAKSAIVDSSGNLTGMLNGRVEVDAQTNLPHAFERHETEADGSTPTPDAAGLNPNARIVYTTSEMIPRSSLADDFFDASRVQSQIETPAENLQKIRDAGLTPLWLGEQYAGPPGLLQLPVSNSVFATVSEQTGEVHYSLIVPTSSTNAQEEPDTVIIRLAADASTFTAPTLQQVGGVLPEQQETVTVNGQPATLYTSTLTPSDLPCDTGTTCPQSDAALYRRIDFAVGTTQVQIEVSARIGADGHDADGYNTKTGIVALAEALMEAPATAPSVTPTPNPLATLPPSS